MIKSPGTDASSYALRISSSGVIDADYGVSHSYGNRREPKWQMALYVGLVRGAMFINIWIVAMQRIPTGICSTDYSKIL